MTNPSNPSVDGAESAGGAVTGRRHDLKTWPIPFRAVRDGTKPWELRFNDRDYQVGDVLCLQEWHPDAEAYTGEELERVVTWMLDGGQFGLPPGYCIMSLAALSPPPLEEGESLRREAVLAALRHNIKVIRALGSSMSPGGLASCIERNIEDVADQLIAALSPRDAPGEVTGSNGSKSSAFQLAEPNSGANEDRERAAETTVAEALALFRSRYLGTDLVELVRKSLAEIADLIATVCRLRGETDADAHLKRFVHLVDHARDISRGEISEIIDFAQGQMARAVRAEAALAAHDASPVSVTEGLQAETRSVSNTEPLLSTSPGERSSDGCHADRDGDCRWSSCPQLRDGEPEKSLRHCPLDTEEGR